MKPLRVFFFRTGSRAPVLLLTVGPLLFVACMVLLSAPVVSAADGFVAGKGSFDLKIRDLLSPYEVIGVFAMPSEIVRMEVREPTDSGSSYTLDFMAGPVETGGARLWFVTAPPAPGLYPVNIVQDESGETIVVNLFVMVPFSEIRDGRLNGYQIGDYPKQPLNNLPTYRPPKGFVEVTEENRDTLVAPHFKLSQFLCKQEGAFPKYLVLREALLVKLEIVLEELNANGIHARNLAILSGYRTPWYNSKIRNVPNSRHLWGGAADIYVDDDPADEMMDDLNHDGRIDYRDAEMIYEVVESLYGKPWYEDFIGGLARYRKTNSHGPFVHVDVRGEKVRW